MKSIRNSWLVNGTAVFSLWVAACSSRQSDDSSAVVGLATIQRVGQPAQPAGSEPNWRQGIYRWQMPVSSTGQSSNRAALPK